MRWQASGLNCGADDDGSPITVHCLAIGDVALPASTWHRKVAKRAVPKGFLSRVFAAEVGVCTASDRDLALPDQRIKVWLGYCEAHCEERFVVSDEAPTVAPTVSFGELPHGELLVPTVEALVALLQAQVAVTPLRTASEGLGGNLAARVSGIEQAVQRLTQALLPAGDVERLSKDTALGESEEEDLEAPAVCARG